MKQTSIFTLSTAVAALLAVPAVAEMKYENDTGGHVRLYGQFNPAYLSFDDGVEETGDIVDNVNSNSRVGIDVHQPFGTNTFRFNFETALGFRPSSGLSQTNTPKGVDWQRTNIRKVDFSLETASYGTFSAGQGSMATDGVAERDLSGTTLVTYSSIPDTAGSMQFRSSDGTLSGIEIGDVFSDFDGGRRGRIRYDTPVFGGGFSVGAAYGKEILATDNDDEFMDVALNYANTFGDYKVDGSVGFSRRDRDGVDRDDTIASVSVRHSSGVNATLALGDRKDAGDYVYGKLGYQAKWFAVGKTSMSIDYYDGNDFNLDVATSSSSSSVGFGVVQKFDNAGVEAYLGYRTYEYSDNTATTYQDASSILVGARWKF